MLVVGSANMDIVVRAPRAPKAGETVPGLGYALYPGGKGANQAVAAARAGATVRLVACVGRDAYGDTLLASLAADQIDTAAVRRADDPTGVALITVDADGENRIIVVPGANHALLPRHVTADIVPGTVMLAQLEVPPPTVIAAAAAVRAAGGATILNASPVAGIDPAALAALLDVTDILLVNETEALQLLGGDGVPTAGIAASRLAAGRRAAVITLGRDGVVWHEGSERGHFPAHDVAVVDTTACGDAFAGVFAASLESGVPVCEAVRFGNAAGALAATRAGAQPSLPGGAHISAFLETQI